MASRPFNVGIIGYGLSAKVFHIPLILTVPEFKIYAIVQRSPKPDDDAEKDHPGVKVYRSSSEMAQDPAIDVIVVTTVPDSHFSLTKEALEGGKHGNNHVWALKHHRLINAVVVEKPFTPTSKEADELIAIAKKHNKLIAVYQSMSNLQ